MALVLIITVGGSWEPLVKSIQKSNPDYTIFICSQDDKTFNTVGSEKLVDGSGKPCRVTNEEYRVSIVAQTGLSAEQYEKIFVRDLDDLAACYQAAMKAIKTAKKKIPGSITRIDYTGGTKTMSSGLAMAAIDHGEVEIYIVSGPRIKLTKVDSGTEMLRQTEWTPIMLMRQHLTLEELFKNKDYIACAELCENLCSQLPGKIKAVRTLEVISVICRGFQAWEEFRHQDALNLLEPYGNMLNNEMIFLRSIVKSNNQFQQQKTAALGEGAGCAPGVKPNLGLVHDIMRNAERRIQRSQYDDAVGRIYRALELLAQISLLYWHLPIYTSHVIIENLPVELQDKYYAIQKMQAHSGIQILQLPLYRAYELLRDLDHPLGNLVWEKRDQMRSVIETRNESIFAHGLRPVERQKAIAFYEFVHNVLVDSENAMDLTVRYDKQARFPEKIPLSLDLDWE